MSEFQAEPNRTFAVVVGVEKYAVGAGWDLNGPTNDAVRFIRWLRGQQVPADRIFTFVTPRDSNQHLLQGLDVNVEPAEHGRITDAITNRLANASGDLLFFFWGGHGVIDALGNRRLYCADATGANPRHLSLNSLLACWRTNIIGRFPRQIGFVDACANYLEFFRTVASMPEDALPMGTPDAGVEQFFLLAASAGEVAKNLAVEKSGAFSLALFDRLERPGQPFPPSMQEINQNLIDHFASLRDAGKARQTPSHFWYREWKGSEGTLGSYKRQVSARPTAEIRLLNEERDQLVEALLEFDAMAINAERESLIADLRREIKFNTLRSDKARYDVDNLVKTALRYPGGVQELIHAVKRFKGADEIAWRDLESVLVRLSIGG